MASAELEQTTVDIEVKGRDGKPYTLRATGSVVQFDGFLKVYEEGRDDRVRVVEKGKEDHAEDDDEPPPARRSPRATASPTASIEAEQHFTQPPPRYSEATLVKRMEELGIGRPSTYASTLAVLQERDYVRIDKKRLDPRGQGPARHRLPRELLQALRRVRLHRRPRGEARPHLRRQARLEGRAARLLARLHGRRRRDQGPARRRGAGGAQRDARARTSSRPRPRAATRASARTAAQGA